MQDRIEQIYRAKAAMGLGYNYDDYNDGGCDDRYLSPMMGMGGARGGKLSAYNLHMRRFMKSAANKRKYRNHKALFKAAAAAWRGTGRKTTRGRRKRCPNGSRKSTRKGSRGKCVKRRQARGRGYDDEDDDDMYGDGILIGGARRRKARPYNPTKKQLENLNMDKASFLKMISTIKDARPERAPRFFNAARTRRVGNRFLKKNVRGNCFQQDPDGPFFLNEQYNCEDWTPKSPVITPEVAAEVLRNFAEQQKKRA